MVWRSYGDEPVPIVWITMSRPGPLGNAQTNGPVNYGAYNSKGTVSRCSSPSTPCASTAVIRSGSPELTER
jgi:hypothetical protein